MFHFLYVLESKIDRSWYIGYTTDVARRLTDHNRSKNTSTKAKKPWQILYFEAYRDKRDALGREKFLKSGSGRKYLKKQMAHYMVESTELKVLKP